ncbi:MAG: MFS transporter [Blastocatellia bacterium]|nr:MFS transporter [Blastocatellia bacterium]
MRSELNLSYVQIGILLSIPNLTASFLEPIIGILADSWNRRTLVLAGAIGFTLSLLAIALANNFLLLLLAFILIAPSSGAFVSLSQATLMDLEPDKVEQNMSKWAFAGSLGIVSGTLLVATTTTLINWRWLFVAMTSISVLLTIVAWRFNFPTTETEKSENIWISFKLGISRAISSAKEPKVLRWIVLLFFSDFMLDILHGFLALYFVDVAKTTTEKAAFAVLVWTLIGLPGDFFLILLLKRFSGLAYLKVSALVVLILFPMFLLIPSVAIKLVILGLLGIFNAGWYAILKAQLYQNMLGQSGTVMAFGSLLSLIQCFIPLALGFIAEIFGLSIAMWFLLLGPLALIVGLYKVEK